MDIDGQVVFFTPSGKVLAGAAPRGWDEVQRKEVQRDAAGKGAESRLAEDWEKENPAGKLRPHPKWKSDHDIPWEVEALAWEALDPA